MEFSHKRVYLTEQSIQIYGVQISEKRIFKSKKWKQTFLLPQGKTLSPVSIITPKAEANYLFPLVKGED